MQELSCILRLGAVLLLLHMYMRLPSPSVRGEEGVGG